MHSFYWSFFFFTSTLFLTHQMIELSILLISNLKKTDKRASLFKAPVNWIIFLIILDLFHHLVCLGVCSQWSRHCLFLRYIPWVYCLFITRNWSFCAAVFINIYGLFFFLSFVCLPVDWWIDHCISFVMNQYISRGLS